MNGSGACDPSRSIAAFRCQTKPSVARVSTHEKNQTQTSELTYHLEQISTADCQGTEHGARRVLGSSRSGSAQGKAQKRINKKDKRDLQPEYDLCKLKGGVRGNHYRRYQAGTNL